MSMMSVILMGGLWTIESIKTVDNKLWSLYLVSMMNQGAGGGKVFEYFVRIDHSCSRAPLEC